MGLFLFLAMVAAAVMYGVAEHNRKVDAAWDWAAKSLGLTRSRQQRLGGRIDGRPVDVETVVRGSGKNKQRFTRISVGAPRNASGLELRKEWAWTKVQKWLGADDVQLADAHFDQRIHVKGDTVQALALLGEDARMNVLRFVDGLGGQLEHGVFVLELPGIATDAMKIIEPVETAVVLGRLMDVHPTEYADRLARQAQHDPEAGVRLRNFEVLAERFHGQPETRRCAAALLDHDDAMLQVAAARELADDRAFATLRTIAESPGRPEARLVAFQALCDLYPYAQFAPTVEAALRTGRPDLRAVAVGRVARAGDASKRELVERCLGKGDDALDEAAAKALGRLGLAASEDALVPLLRSESESVKRAAVEALGRLASVRVVESLLPLTKGFSLGGGLKDAARDAIRRIQSRVGEAEGGRLSVVDAPGSEEGALSLAVEGGALSFADPVDEPAATQDGPAPGPSRVRG